MSLEQNLLPSRNDTKLLVHAFALILTEYVKGIKTGVDCREAVETILGVEVLSAGRLADITDTLAYINGGADETAKLQRVDEFYKVCIGAECMQRFPTLAASWYGTQDSMRARLAWSEAD
jgi:hypothetical protein